MKKLILSALVIFSSLGFSHSAQANAPDHFSFVFHTSQGDLNFDCPQGWSPLGEQRIYELVSDGFFTNTAFFRVITGFVAQFGLSGDPATNAKWENSIIQDDPVVASNVAGTLTFATAGPKTRTTQLFINLVDNTRLDAKGFSPVCKLTNADGLAIANKLYAGYGEGTPQGNGPDQDLITTQGAAYLKNFPLLDYLTSADFL